MRRIDHDVAEIGVRREVADRARETHEPIAIQDAEAHGAAHRALQLLARHVARPKRGVQKRERLIERNGLAVRGEDVLAAAKLERLVTETRGHFRVSAK